MKTKSFITTAVGYRLPIGTTPAMIAATAGVGHPAEMRARTAAGPGAETVEKKL